MKLKKLLAILLVIALIFSFTACSGNKGDKSSEKEDSSVTDTVSSDLQQSTDSNDNQGPLLYKITDANGNTAYLFGSIHVGRESFYPLPDSVIDAFDSSDVLAVEFDVIAFEKDMSAATDALMVMMYSDMTQITDHISNEVYSAAVEVLEKEKTYMSYLDYFSPSLWSNLIDNFVYEKLGIDINSGIDRHLIERAYEKNKEVDDVESAELQFSMLANYSDELQEVLLQEAVESYNQVQTEEGVKEYLAELSVLMDAWEKGDPNEIYKIANDPGEFENADEKVLYDEYQKAMITDRNIGMADYTQAALRSGKTVFVCVGAAHVVGEGGIADLMQKRGYTVEVVK